MWSKNGRGNNMSNTIRTLWLSDAIELIMRDDCNEIDVKGKKFALIKHGHWDRVEDDFGSIWQCSNCKAESITLISS